MVQNWTWPYDIYVCEETVSITMPDLNKKGCLHKFIQSMSFFVIQVEHFALCGMGLYDGVITLLNHLLSHVSYNNSKISILRNPRYGLKQDELIFRRVSIHILDFSRC